MQSGIPNANIRPSTRWRRPGAQRFPNARPEALVGSCASAVHASRPSGQWPVGWALSSEVFRSGVEFTMRQVIVRWPLAQDDSSGYR